MKKWDDRYWFSDYLFSRHNSWWWRLQLGCKCAQEEKKIDDNHMETVLNFRAIYSSMNASHGSGFAEGGKSLKECSGHQVKDTSASMSPQSSIPESIFWLSQRFQYGIQTSSENYQFSVIRIKLRHSVSCSTLKFSVEKFSISQNRRHTRTDCFFWVDHNAAEERSRSRRWASSSSWLVNLCNSFPINPRIRVANNFLTTKRVFKPGRGTSAAPASVFSSVDY